MGLFLTIYILGFIIALILEYIMNIYVEGNDITITELIVLILFCSGSLVSVLIQLIFLIAMYDKVIIKSKKK